MLSEGARESGVNPALEARVVCKLLRRCCITIVATAHAGGVQRARARGSTSAVWTTWAAAHQPSSESNLKKEALAGPARSRAAARRGWQHVHSPLHLY